MKGTGRSDWGLLILRIGLGLLFVFYGAMKMFPIFGSKGYVDTVNSFIADGIPPVFAHLAIVAEFFGGLGVLFGFLTPIASFGIFCTMAVATYKMLAPGFNVNQPSTVLFPAILGVMALGILVMGAGKYSIDARYFRRGGR